MMGEKDDMPKIKAFVEVYEKVLDYFSRYQHGEPRPITIPKYYNLWQEYLVEFKSISARIRMDNDLMMYFSSIIGKSAREREEEMGFNWIRENVIQSGDIEDIELMKWHATYTEWMLEALCDVDGFIDRREKIAKERYEWYTKGMNASLKRSKEGSVEDCVEKLRNLCTAKFKGAGDNKDKFTDNLIPDIKYAETAIELAKIAYMLKENGTIPKSANISFARLLKIIFGISGGKVGYYNYKPSETQKEINDEDRERYKYIN